MSIFIDQIELKNWFNYAGDYQKNCVKFSRGLNIIVGDNNSGKTKLHNAFRWIIKDEVLIISNETVKETIITQENLYKVLNSKAFRSLKHGEKTSLGVRLRFTKSIGDDKITYLLTREIECRKDVDSLQIIRECKQVQLFSPITNGLRTSDESFEYIVKQIISPKFHDFFLIEGEQLGQLTPLQGPNLQNTINSLVNLNNLDKLTRKVKSLHDKSVYKYYDIEAEENRKNESIQNDLITINEKSGNIEELKRQQKLVSEKLTINNILKKKYEAKAAFSEKRKVLLEKFHKLNTDVKVAESKKEEHERAYITNLLDKSFFAIGKAIDDSTVLDRINEIIKEFQSFVSQRRAELNTNIDSEMQDMVLSLEKSQPKPEILKQMVQKGRCFVCYNLLSDASVIYINDILVPYFSNTETDDSFYNKLEDLFELFKGIYHDSKDYYLTDKEYFIKKKEEIEKLAENIIIAQDKRDDFIAENGAIDEAEEDEVNIITYKNAVTVSNQCDQELATLKTEITNLGNAISDLEEKIKNNREGERSKKNISAENLRNFAKELYDFLKELKKQTYLDFAVRLEEKATQRFQQLMKHNIRANKHKVKVETLQKNQEDEEDFEYKIEIVNTFGEFQDQAGGADQALRRVSVVFALVDLSENKNGHPFIADAPVSRLSEDTKKEFFNCLLNDQAVNQSIIFSMDLLSAKETNEQGEVVLNKLGRDVLDLIQQNDNARFITIHLDNFEYLKN